MHTGYASVAALHDVVAGEEAAVLRTPARRPASDRLPAGAPGGGDVPAILRGRAVGRPRPGVDPALPRGPGERPAPPCSCGRRCPSLPAIAELVLRTPMRAFGRRPLAALIDPGRVSPEALDALERRLGTALFTSMHWIWTGGTPAARAHGPARGHAAGTGPGRTPADRRGWMLRLGGALQAA